MGLKKIRGWKVVNEYYMSTADGTARIVRGYVGDKLVYILWPNANAKVGQRHIIGPFYSAADAGDAYECYLEGLSGKEGPEK